MDPFHRIFPLENNSINPHHFAKRPLFLWNINPQSINFHEDPQVFKNNSKYTPSHFQKLPISVILVPKFSEYFTL
jgi:hypothetical protein